MESIWLVLAASTPSTSGNMDVAAPMGEIRNLLSLFINLILCVCVCVQLVIIVIPVNFTLGQKQINHLQMTSSSSAATLESLCCIQPRLGNLQAGFPIPNPNKPNWSPKLISVPLLKSLIRPKTS